MLAPRTCQPYQAVLTVNLQRDALGSIFAKTRWMHNHRLPNASLNINKHDTLALDAILISFSAKQPAVAPFAAKTRKIAEIWTRSETPRGPRHSQSAYEPVQTRARIGCTSETREKVRNRTKRCSAKCSRTFECEHSGAVGTYQQAFCYNLRQNSTRSAVGSQL